MNKIYIIFGLLILPLFPNLFEGITIGLFCQKGNDNYPDLSENCQEVKNIIFFIGDGMGINQITAARIQSVGANGRLAIDKMAVTGLVTNHSIDRLITESAASATAMATGYKTRNKMVGVSPDTSILVTILEAARDKGMSTGLVATSSITHATPACFAAHVASRQDHATIAQQIVEANVEVVFGGGRKYFIPKRMNGSKRDDEMNLIEVAEQKGYKYVENKAQLVNAGSDRILGLFQLGPMETLPQEPSLAQMTEKAINILNKNDSGFFLLVEGSQIDWASHDNNFEECVRQLLLFDDAIDVAINFADNNKSTLIIITADHETGGMNIVGGDVDGQDIKIKWISKSHTGQMIPLFAYGPQAFKFTGIKDNTDIPKILARLLGIADFPRVILKNEVNLN
jgi:alkaline phosphatase